MMTKQEVFDKVVAHLRAQNRKALNEDHRCVYRAPEGTKCAAGCLILNEHYSYSLEGKAVWHAAVAHALRRSGVPEEAFALVRALQKTHDNYFVSQWENELINVAYLFDLTYSAPVAS